jgi:hypothetical protein
MSAAKVAFKTLDYDDAPAGAEQRFGFACPKHIGRRCEGLLIAGRTRIKRDGQGRNGGVPQWDWDGDRAAPTFTPSVNCKGCWHGYIRAGRCVDTAGGDEPEPQPRPVA